MDAAHTGTLVIGADNAFGVYMRRSGGDDSLGARVGRHPHGRLFIF